jgi:nucleotide-binding universal stress UspA family protein
MAVARSRPEPPRWPERRRGRRESRVAALEVAVYSDIMVPLDGSTFAEHALPCARPLAHRTGATLHLVLVHVPFPIHTEELAPMATYERWEEEHRVREEGYLGERAEALRGGGLQVTAEVRHGDVGRELRARAETGIDLIVMATHGRGGIERAWLGSVTDALLRHARTPMLVVRPTEDEPTPGGGLPRHILAATDGSVASDAAVEEAAALARLTEAKLTLLSVVAFPAGLASTYVPHAAREDREVVEKRQAEATRMLEERAAALDGPTPELRVDQAYHAARGILDTAGEVGADLIVIGTDHRTRVGRVLLGSVADKVVRGATVPVLVARARDSNGD